MKTLKSLITFAAIIPIFLSSCKHPIKYKELSLSSHYVFLTAQDAYLRTPDSSSCLPFMIGELELTYAKFNNGDLFINKGSKVEISKIYAAYKPTYSGPIPSTYMQRYLICCMVDVKSKKRFWMHMGYKEVSVDLKNQVSSVELDMLQSPVTGRTATISMPLNVWNKNDMIEFTPLFN